MSDTAGSYPVRPVILILLAASLITVALPYSIADIGGDRFGSQMYINCFAGHFWQGMLYPRWCFDLEAGLGAPVFVFYFPLPFWIASLAWPLTWVGLSESALYDLLIITSVFLSGVTSYLWLKPLFPQRAALGGALIYMMAAPYHMELLFHRSAYAELWLVALLPLAFSQLRAVMQGKPYATARLAAVYGLCILTHLPGAVIISVGAGLYALAALTSLPDSQRMKRLGMAMAGFLGGFTIAAFYALPALYYEQFVWGINTAQGNEYPSIDAVMHGVYLQGYVDMVVSLVMIVMLWVMYRLDVRKPGTSMLDTGARDELRRWGIVLAGALFLFFPFLKPLWLVLPLLKNFIFPWRMQLLWMPFLSIMSAAIITLRSNAAPPRPWKGDIATLITTVLLIAFHGLKVFMPGMEDDVASLYKIKLLLMRGHTSIWVDTPHNTAPVLREHYYHPQPVKAASPGTHINLRQWGPDRIILDVDAAAGDTVFVPYYYFPIWHVDVPGFTLAPENGSGRMVLSVPAGHHTVTIGQEVYGGTPWWVRFSPFISLFAAVATVTAWLRGKHAASLS